MTAAREAINSAISTIENIKENLVEPEVINNEDAVARLDRAINFLEKAVDELDD